LRHSKTRGDMFWKCISGLWSERMNEKERSLRSLVIHRISIKIVRGFAFKFAPTQAVYV
jgi:hypothetical protein